MRTLEIIEQTHDVDVNDMMDEEVLLGDEAEYDPDEEFWNEEAEKANAEEIKIHGRKLTDKERIENFFAKYESMEPIPLLEGIHLYRPVQASYINDAAPSLKKDLKFLKQLNGGSTQLYDRIKVCMLRLFAPDLYDAFCQMRAELYHIPSYFFYDEIEKIADFLEEFRRFMITAKRPVSIDQLKNGDVLYTNRIVVVKGGHPFLLRQGPGWSNEKIPFHFDAIGEYQRKQRFFVVGWTHVDPDKIEKKWIPRAYGTSMDEWMRVLRSISLQFPSARDDRPGFDAYHVVRKKYLQWYFANPEKVAQYYKKKNRKSILLSDLPYWLRKQVIDEMRKYPWYELTKGKIKIIWKGKAYRFPSFGTFVESPLFDLIKSGDPRAYKIDFAFDEWYSWDTHTDVLVLGEQHELIADQMSLFTETNDWIAPNDVEQLQMFG
ncbi:hypothetical protein QO009_002991 [Brevibacillus aydinogluensis]|jgi:hypothetical protein|uniref:hypothetical protein n=1 Tax=Brevibacillus aydinogluensis TaxID=927786 RepID=UPI0028936C4C|nr:hypothetical protein [Brevibacillus aydinogluensis]MDT3417096.1 hypothetical protein [Brevibacillus aydinogluensis]